MPLLFVDTASPEEVAQYSALPFITGLTTNPSLVAKHIRPDESYLEFLVRLLSNLKNNNLHVSIELLTYDVDAGVAQAERINEELEDIDNIFFKVPLLTKTTSLIAALSKRGLFVNATAVITPSQAFIARESGARAISFFYRRACDFYGSTKEALENVRNAFDLFDGDINTICGSIRTPQDVVDCWSNGALAVTAPPKVIDQMFVHQKTDEAVSQFEEASKTWQF
jgi:transaldolase